MARSKKIKRRQIDPDPKYKSVLVAKLVNRAMDSGKKTTARKHVYQAIEKVAKETKKNGLEMLEEAIKNITPQMEVRSRRVGGAAYQVPVPVKSHRGSALALRWLVNESNKRSNREYATFADKLTAEVLDALQETGGAYQRKITAHKMAEANKAFAHFRW